MTTNRFLNSGKSLTIEDVSNGALPIYVSDIRSSSLLPNLPVKTDSKKQLYSTLLQASDVQGVITTPYNGTIEAKDFETNKYFSINDELQKIDNLDASTINNTNINGRLHITGEMSIPKITDPTELTRIELDDTDINIISQNLSWNGSDVIIASGTNQQYIMGNGSLLQYSANSGNSNFYLYNNGTNQEPTPANGIITYNNINQADATIIYISHRTRDTIDIEVFFKNISTLNDVYIQDQENSDNNITYNIMGDPVIVNQAQITIPVVATSSNGTGSTNFGNGHNLLLSFFTNSIETDTRISALETKTQNQSGSLVGTDFTNNLSVILRVANGDFFTIRNDAAPFSINKFNVSNTSVQISSIPLQMNNQKIQLLGTPVDPSDATRKDYVDNLITPLQEKTINISGATLITTIVRNTQFKLTGTDTFSIRDNALPPNDKFVVDNTGIQARVPMTMNTFALSGIPNPINLDDCTNKSYVDTNFIKMVSNTFTASWGAGANLITRTFTYKYIIDSTGSKIVTLGIPYIRTAITGGPLPLFSSNATSLPAIIRPVAESISAIRIVVNNVFEFGYIALSAAGLISFVRIAASWTNNNNGNGSGNGLLGDYMYITYVAA